MAPKAVTSTELLPGYVMFDRRLLSRFVYAYVPEEKRWVFCITTRQENEARINTAALFIISYIARKLPLLKKQGNIGAEVGACELSDFCEFRTHQSLPSIRPGRFSFYQPVCLEIPGSQRIITWHEIVCPPRTHQRFIRLADQFDFVSDLEREEMQEARKAGEEQYQRALKEGRYPILTPAQLYQGGYQITVMHHELPDVLGVTADTCNRVFLNEEFCVGKNDWIAIQQFGTCYSIWKRARQFTM